MAKVFVFGIDGAPPELIFSKWMHELPNIKKLMDGGIYAKMDSAIPPSTIIAWNSMLSGKDTSEIGVYSYTFKDKEGNTQIVSSENVRCRLLWDYLGDAGKKSIVLHVPLTYPVRRINGIMVSDFLTPGIDSNCAYPESIKDRIRKLGNTDLFFDVSVSLAGHKGLKVDELIKKTYEMTDMQINLIKDLAQSEKWDFFMAVMIGTDRLQHMLWRHFDQEHRRFISDSKYKDALKEYYIYLDRQLGNIVKMLDKDTIVIVCSDHGMVRQEGKININMWLIREGYLKLKQGINPLEKKRFSVDYVDMENSVAWGGGAYNARVFLNRKKVGEEYNVIKDELARKLKGIPNDKGGKLDTKVYVAEDIYNKPAGDDCPDLTVYFDDLRWASNPDLGFDGIYSWESAVGADSAGHSRQGCFILSNSNAQRRGMINDIDIRQVAPTILKLLKVKIPKDIAPKPIEVD